MNTKIYNLSLLSLLLLLSCGEKEKPSFEEVLNSDKREEIQQLKEDLYHDQRELLVKIEKLDKKLASFEDENKLRLVEALEVTSSTFKHFIKIQGNVTTDENILIYPEFSGVLTDVFVKEGDLVKKGQLLARIDDGGLQNQLAEMKAQQALAKTVF
jgi:multidrug efflux pump subunit AcrA (membrane-fusion protein)